MNYSPSSSLFFTPQIYNASDEKKGLDGEEEGRQKKGRFCVLTFVQDSRTSSSSHIVRRKRNRRCDATRGPVLEYFTRKAGSCPRRSDRFQIIRATWLECPWVRVPVPHSLRTYIPHTKYKIPHITYILNTMYTNEHALLGYLLTRHEFPFIVFLHATRPRT